MRATNTLALAVVCLAITLAGCGRGYRLPVGDGITRHSPPSIEGQLTAVGPDQLTLEAGGRSVVIELQPTTRYFKTAGGTVFREELQPGQRVQVWYKSRSGGIETGQPAAVVMVASLDPNDPIPSP